MQIGKWGLCMGIVLASLSAAQGADEMQVMIQGAADTSFKADWVLTPLNGGSEQQGRWTGQVPQTYRLPPGRLDVVLKQTSARGRLDVTVSSGSNRSFSSTQGQGSEIRLSVQ